MKPEINVFATQADLAPALAERITAQLTRAISQRGSATLAVSGGSTPAPLFAALRDQQLDWGSVSVTLVDERWVDEQHADSNARLVREQLLQGAAAGARFVGLWQPAASACDAETEVAARLQGITAALDVAVLGMGEDGHTASFFPGAAALPAALDPQGTRDCIAVTPLHAPHERMTLTLPVLLRCANLYLHTVGEGKWAVLQRALEQGSVDELPVRAVIHQEKTQLQIYHAQRG